MAEQQPLIRARPRRRKKRWHLFLALVIVLLGLLSLPPSLLPSFSDIISPESPRTALILTAHPDDEVMFFSPTILSLIKSGWDLRALCLSVGNGSGLGEIRREELYRSYEALGISPDHVEIVDHPKLQDGMTNIWETEIILPIIEDYLLQENVPLIITFDTVGITRHPNHIPLAHAITQVETSARILHLHSPSVLGKFTGPLFAIYYNVSSHLSRFIPSAMPRKAGGWTTVVVISTPRHFIRGIQAMLEHRSQLVWFRWLYLAFSRLMWVNELVISGV